MKTMEAITGIPFGEIEREAVSLRSLNMRQAFNLREGIAAESVRLPERMLGRPPQTDGPLAGVTIDVDSLAQEYRQAMGWHAETGVPTKETLETLGLSGLVEKFG